MDSESIDKVTAVGLCLMQIEVPCDNLKLPVALIRDIDRLHCISFQKNQLVDYPHVEAQFTISIKKQWYGRDMYVDRFSTISHA